MAPELVEAVLEGAGVLVDGLTADFLYPAGDWLLPPATPDPRLVARLMEMAHAAPAPDDRPKLLAELWRRDPSVAETLITPGTAEVWKKAFVQKQSGSEGYVSLAD